MRKSIRWIFIGILILGASFGLTWIIAQYRASPPPIGETYHVVANWPQLPTGLILGQVTGVDVDSRGNVFVFHRAERVWNGEPIWPHTIAVGPDGALYVGEVGIGMRIQKFVR